MPTYLAAGERLNAGHNLYAFGAGDRPIILDPQYWTVPLLSPPPIAVLWRSLALLGTGAMLAGGSPGSSRSVAPSSRWRSGLLGSPGRLSSSSQPLVAWAGGRLGLPSRPGGIMTKLRL